nr:transmembrane protein 53-like isoform X2 [Cherax quadricarinatus]
MPSPIFNIGITAVSRSLSPTITATCYHPRVSSGCSLHYTRTDRFANPLWKVCFQCNSDYIKRVTGLKRGKMEDDLEYFITFPTPTPKETHKRTSARCITIRYTSPLSYMFARPGARNPIARKLLALLRDMSLDDHPVFFHIFSNNGSILYYSMTKAFTEPDAPNISVKGIIFDSTPSPRRLYSGCTQKNTGNPCILS